MRSLLVDYQSMYLICRASSHSYREGFSHSDDAVEVGQVERQPDNLPFLELRQFRLDLLNGFPSPLLASCRDVHFRSMASALYTCRIADTGAVLLSAIYSADGVESLLFHRDLLSACDNGNLPR
jgi:hypothetical protein